jgi:ring-1,2-phenylacetyl-CoA epoxidase subunit PaaB
MGACGCDRTRRKTTRLQHASRVSATPPSDSQWPLWEVFLQPPKGAAHEHAGSVHAPSAEHALQNARDVYARRGEAVSIWVVPSVAITASTPDDMGPFFDPGNDKAYRHPQFYKVPQGVRVF